MAQAPPERDVLSLAQGVVHWHPPPEATAAAAQLMAAAAAATDGSGSGAQGSCETMKAVYGTGGVHSYGPPDGLPALTAALRDKVATKNGLRGYEVMVTNGANQAFVNIVLALVDTRDRVVLFRPYYFNHIMTLQMTGGADQVVLGPCQPDSLHPDLDWLQQQLSGASGQPPPKMVVIVNPCNPTGVLLPEHELQRAADLCAAAGCWLVLDNTYEDFVYSATSRHHCVAGHNVLNVFSFSKAYGMMGWRVGYIAYPGQQLLQEAGRGAVRLGEQLMKIQDTVAICPGQLAQHMALAALRHGGEYLQRNIAGLQANRALVADALSPLGEHGAGWVGGEHGAGWVGGQAIYFWAKLPERFSGSSSSSNGAAAAAAGSDEDVVAWLIREHGVCVIPGSACGAPGYIRVAFANVSEQQCRQAAARLKAGLQQLLTTDSVLQPPAAALAGLHQE